MPPSRLTTDRETQNGIRAERIGDRHWRCEARADTDHYSYYFHVSLISDADGAGILDIHPDTDRPGAVESFRRHRPDAVWVRSVGAAGIENSAGSAEAEWRRVGVDPDAPDPSVRVRLPLAAGIEHHIARMRPTPYSEILERLQALADRPGVCLTSLGHSSQGREIPLLEIDGGGPSVWVIAGQHSTEFGGVEAALGIAEGLAAGNLELGDPGCRCLIAPVVNPDGNVGGHPGCTTEGVDLYRAFTGAVDGQTPGCAEAAALWSALREIPPALVLNMHCYTGCSAAGRYPWEGLYTVSDAAFRSEGARERQRRLDSLMARETGGLSQHGRFSTHAEGSLEHQLAALGTPTVFYEHQDAHGPAHQHRTGLAILRHAQSILDQ